MDINNIKGGGRGGVGGLAREIFQHQHRELYGEEPCPYKAIPAQSHSFRSIVLHQTQIWLAQDL